MISNETTISRIKELLKTLRVYVNNDGGDVEFIKYENDILHLKITGACATCPYVGSTFDQGIKLVLLNEIKEIKDVVFEM